MMGKIVDILNGMTGYVLSVALVVALAVILGYQGLIIQQQQSRNTYSIDKNAIEMKSRENIQYYKLIKE